jgi:protein-tyrosine-phosphatase
MYITNHQEYLNVLANPENTIIVIVDRGNIARSVIAAILMSRLPMIAVLESLYPQRIALFSCGIQGVNGIETGERPVGRNLLDYPDLYAQAKDWLTAKQIDLTNEYSEESYRYLLEKANLIIPMDRKTYDALVEWNPNVEAKLCLFTAFELNGEQEGIGDPDTEVGDGKILEKFLQIDEIINNHGPDMIMRAHNPEKNEPGIEIKTENRLPSM